MTYVKINDFVWKLVLFLDALLSLQRDSSFEYAAGDRVTMRLVRPHREFPENFLSAGLLGPEKSATTIHGYSARLLPLCCGGSFCHPESPEFRENSFLEVLGYLAPHARCGTPGF